MSKLTSANSHGTSYSGSKYCSSNNNLNYLSLKAVCKNLKGLVDDLKIN